MANETDKLRIYNGRIAYGGVVITQEYLERYNVPPEVVNTVRRTRALPEKGGPGSHKLINAGKAALKEGRR